MSSQSSSQNNHEYVLIAQGNLHNMPQATAEMIMYINSAMKNYRLDETQDKIVNIRKPSKKQLLKKREIEIAEQLEE